MKLTDYKKLPRIKCIYALYDNIDKLYIGSTADLRDRAYRQSNMIFESISEFERLNNLYEGYVKYQYRRCGPKNFKFEINGKNYVLKKYEDMV